jgi:hypothetical protein
MTENNPMYREFLKSQGFVEWPEWQFEHSDFDCIVIIDGGWLFESSTPDISRPVTQGDDVHTLRAFWQKFVADPPWPRRAVQ